METGFDRKRRIGFSVPVVLFLAMGTMLAAQGGLVHAVTGWFPGADFGDHRFHELVIPYLLLAMLAGAVVQLHRPQDKVVPLQHAVAIPALVFLAELAAGEVNPPPLVFVILGLVAVALHPDRAELLSWGRSIRSLVAWTVVGAVPLAVYAYQHVQMHRMAPAGDEHAELGHWTAMAAVAAGIAVLGLLGAQDKPGRPITAWSAVVVAGVFGLASVVFPGEVSSLGIGWGVLALVWAAGYAVLTVRAGSPDPRPLEGATAQASR